MINNRIERFVEAFEKAFGKYLLPCQKKNDDAYYTKHFSIFTGKKKKYSDWDLHCYFIPTSAESDVLKKMEGCIGSFFDDTGILIAMHQIFYKLVHYINNAQFFQVMGFMKNTEFAPFVDITIKNVPNAYLQKQYGAISGQDFIDWIILTYWRKLKFQPPATKLLDDMIIPILGEAQRQEIENRPDQVFSEFFQDRYPDEVKFLKQS
jgi:hypothetical protein